ncbi:MAG: ATP-grasp domain-containing protein [Planctomycetota bacterium]|nr:ATP-grasp domain-containing protein [Planctomycetota bacterium]MDA1213681.1 ATP-grasp domain-containing protein [Planctomycetota bacterium]
MSAASEKPDLLIAGASARACAFSALRAGLRPYCFDQFADADLQEMAPVERVERYPHDLPRKMARFEGIPWMYTGALENYPEIVAEISRIHPLFGNAPGVLEKVRDPFLVAEWLSDAGLKVVPLRRSNNPPSTDGTWLFKPLRGSAGIGIRRWDEMVSRDFAHVNTRKGYYYQEFHQGESYSALFSGDGSSARMLGMTRQLIGRPEFHAVGFTYCGSIGPIDSSDLQTAYVQRLGHVLAEKGRLVGLFGCDLMVHRDNDTGSESVSLIEINPRYPASTEVLEIATGRSMLEEHLTGSLRAQPELGRFSELLQNEVQSSRISFRGCVGKAILYAPRQFVVKDILCAIDPIYGPMISDVPQVGETIEAGHPICTILAKEKSIIQCEQHLHHYAAIIFERVFGQ